MKSRARHRWLLLLPVSVALSGCISHRYRPDPATLTSSADCEIVNGNYAFESTDDGRVIAEFVFGSDGNLSSLAISKTGNELTLRGTAEDGGEAPVASFARFSCGGAVLTVVLKDEYSAPGMGPVMEASDRFLEIFATDDAFLNLRFISRTLAFFYIVPYYVSTDQLVTLKRLATDEMAAPGCRGR